MRRSLHSAAARVVPLVLTVVLASVVALAAGFGMTGCAPQVVGDSANSNSSVSGAATRPAPGLDSKAPPGLETATFALG